jgi:hypothetical protein
MKSWNTITYEISYGINMIHNKDITFIPSQMQVQEGNKKKRKLLYHILQW